MKPESIAEQTLYNTVRLETLDGGSGTGFFFNFEIDGKSILMLVTNKHVVNNNPNETMRFELHLMGDDHGDSGENYLVTYQTQWLFHPTHDLCATFTKPLFDEVYRRTGKRVFCRINEENLICDEEHLKELDALESVLMVGYPRGLWDHLHNYPLFRKGFTASHPGYDFNERSIGVVDMACFQGSSGSPIFILDKNGYADKMGNQYWGKNRFILLGVLFQGPTIDINGDISIVDIPTQQRAIVQSRMMMNLGYYIKAYELLAFKPMLKKLIDGE